MPRFLLRLLAALALGAGLLAPAGAEAPAGASRVEVHLFWREGCPHCEREREFLRRFAALEPRVVVREYELLRDRENLALFLRATAALGVDSGAVPLTVVGDRVWVGYIDDLSTGRAITDRVAECLATACPDTVKASMIAPAKSPREWASPSPGSGATAIPETLRLPLLGEVRTASLSLPVLTVMLAALDGFNPCAMWVLVFLLGLLVGMQDRVRMWLLGSTFVAASALVYFVFLAAWLNIFLFIGAFSWIQLAIGLVALAGGAYYLREFWANPEAVCKVTGTEERQRTFARLKELTQQRDLWLALGGIVLLAFAVNVVELLCSAGIPAVYTQVLTMSQLGAWQYYAYLALYIVVFMLDDLFVLVVTLRTLEIAGLTSRYTRWSNLIGGVVLAALGLVLLFRPGWLAFG